MEKISRWRHSIDQSNNETQRIPGPSLETLWIPAGWGKTLNRSQSSFDLNQQPRQLRNSSSQLITKQLQTKKSIKSLSTIVKDPIGLCILEIPHWVNVEAIISVFSRFGSIVNVGIDKREMLAFVDFESSISVRTAMQELNGKVYFGGPLILKERYDKNRSSLKMANHDDSVEDVDMFTLYIASLPQYVKKSDLKEGFEQFGAVKRIHIGNKGKDFNFAMITFQDMESSSLAIEFLKSNNIFGVRILTVDYAKVRNYALSRSESKLNIKGKLSSVNEIAKRLNGWNIKTS